MASGNVNNTPHGEIVVSAFQPAKWLRNPHIQTLYPFLARRGGRPVTRRERLSLPDGDFVDLDWAIGAPPKAPWVLVLHGLEGSIRSHYAVGLLNRLTAAGYRAVLMHFRGCSGEPNRLPRSYHSGETGDLDYVVRTLQQRELNTPLGVIGFSLGGNVLLKWLGEQRTEAPVTAAVAVSVPFSLSLAATRLEQGLSRLYQAYLLRKLRRSLRAKQSQVELPLDLHNLRKLQTFRAFDNAVTAPLHGFNGVDDYYARASSRPYLSRISRPTLIIHALDDPFMTSAIVPDQNELSPWVRLELSSQGGHVGFIGGSIRQPTYWIEHRVTEFLMSHLPC